MVISERRVRTAHAFSFILGIAANPPRMNAPGVDLERHRYTHYFNCFPKSACAVRTLRSLLDDSIDQIV